MSEFNKVGVQSIIDRNLKNISKGKRFIFTKREFQRLFKYLGAPKDFDFYYGRTGNDPPESRNGGRTALYDFWILVGNIKVMVAWKGHRRIHDEVEEELREKFTRWANEVLDKEG